MQAFPLQETDDYHGQAGMTLRDYFAAKAMQTILAQSDVFDGRALANAAWISYQMATEMMEARNVAQ